MAYVIFSVNMLCKTKGIQIVITRFFKRLIEALLDYKAHGPTREEFKGERDILVMWKVGFLRLS